MSTEDFLLIKDILHNRAPRAPPVCTTCRFLVWTTPWQPPLAEATTPSPLLSSIHPSKKSYVKLLWCIGDITKSVYTNHYCSRLNSFHQDYLCGNITHSQLQAKKEQLVAYIATSGEDNSGGERRTVSSSVATAFHSSWRNGGSVSRPRLSSSTANAILTVYVALEAARIVKATKHLISFPRQQPFCI